MIKNTLTMEMTTDAVEKTVKAAATTTELYIAIPEELKKLNNWVCWKSEPDLKSHSGIKKTPVNPHTGGNAMSNNPDTWSDFETAVKASEKYAGIGFMFDGNGYFGVDLDDMPEDIQKFKNGENTGIVSEFVNTLQSYTETSQSGNGIHIICKGELPKGARRKGKIEMYEKGRFFIMTGNICAEYADISDCTEKIKSLHKKYLENVKKAKNTHTTQSVAPAPLNLSDNEIINKAMISKQGQKFKALYNGDWTGYSSWSEADIAFCNMLAFWCGKDIEMMDNLFRKSGLMRDKWDRKQSGTTYGRITLEKAATECNNVYDPQKSIKDNYRIYIGSNDKNYDIDVPDVDIDSLTAETLLDESTFVPLYFMDSDVEIAAYINTVRAKAKEFRLVKEFDDLARAHKKAAEKALKEREIEEYNRQKQEIRLQFNTPDWVLENHWGEPYINEPDFAEWLISQKDMKCINGNFYCVDGFIPEGELLSKIQNCISKHIIKNVAQTTTKLYNVLVNRCYSAELSVKSNEIHVNNGLLLTDGTFMPEKRFCVNRLNVNYNPDAKPPVKWLSFLLDLLENEDIFTLQEFIGYCFIPTKKSQQMLFLIGNGGEGKSVIGEVLEAIFKSSMIEDKISCFEDKFFLSTLENKLLMLDDDLEVAALAKTGALKSNVTENKPISIEKKFQNKYNAYLYNKILVFGNQCLSSLYDNSDGFWRRQLIIKTKPKDDHRIDNANLANEIIENELDGVFNWAFEGLQRLIANGFKLTESERAKQAKAESQAENMNYILFLQDRAEYGSDYQVASAELYSAYVTWCSENAFQEFKKTTVIKYLRDNAEKLGIIHTNHAIDRTTHKQVRGFKGIRIKN